MFVAELAGTTWRKSSYSGSGSNDNCVEVAWRTAGEPSVAVRDSKNPAAGTLAVPRAAWARFLRTV